MDSDDDYSYAPRVPHERGVWSQDEHDKFLAAVALHPHGPWKTIAALVGTRSVRQVQTHAQKYHEKVNRRARGLQKNRLKVARAEHRVDDAAQDFLLRPRGGKGHKRGKYNKRNRDARVAPIPPRPSRVNALPAPVPVPSLPPHVPSPTATALLDDLPFDLKFLPLPLRPPPVACGHNDNEDEDKHLTDSGGMADVPAPLPSPNEVGSPDIFRTALRAPASPIPSTSRDLLLDAADLFPLTDDSRPTTPLLLSSPAPATADAVDIDSMLYDDIVAVEEAPEHALSFGEVPTLNDALDYFLKVMTVWGPGQAAASSPVSSVHR